MYSVQVTDRSNLERAEALCHQLEAACRRNYANVRFIAYPAYGTFAVAAQSDYEFDSLSEFTEFVIFLLAEAIARHR